MIADRARCTPWQLEEAPSWWVDRVRLALMAENNAQAARQARAARRARIGGR